jgi:hypothetical protein
MFKQMLPSLFFLTALTADEPPCVTNWTTVNVF